ncbi:MAG TPA: tetratricopeptide repeat protein [Gemmatimonadales bacterium]|nr:tetratricopeptide repeat protein [Gemmatimonadales bacterium]
MATTVTAAEGSTAWAGVVEWLKAHRRWSAYAGFGLLVAAGLFGWSLLSSRTAEKSASRQLEQGRLALETKNYPFAASVLSQVVENYSGTRAADEGIILLAQVRLAQGQTQQAIDVLQRYAPKADRQFQSQAYGLLGAAYENAARPKDAAGAYQSAADDAPYPFLRAQFLSDAGRAWLAAGDTTKALAAYQTIAAKLDSTSAAGEAKVRIGELTKGRSSGPK